MKLLLDENLPVNLRLEITGHDCETVAFRGWSGKKNGELLSLAAGTDFDALVTKDGNLPYQQGADNLPQAVVVLSAPTNKLQDIRLLLPDLIAALDTLPPRQVTFIA